MTSEFFSVILPRDGDAIAFRVTELLERLSMRQTVIDIKPAAFQKLLEDEYNGKHSKSVAFYDVEKGRRCVTTACVIPSASLDPIPQEYDNVK